MNLLQNYMMKIPGVYKREYINIICKENFSRMLIIAVLIAIVEPFLAIFVEEYQSPSFYLAIWIGLLALVFTPILYYFKKNIGTISKQGIMLVQTIFLIWIIMCGIAWSMYEQQWLASSSTYFLAVFTISAFIIMPPVISAVLLLYSNFAFILLLPQFQSSADVIVTLNINTLCMSAVAWILNQMVSRSEVKSFLNEKTILEKNLELEKKNAELSELTMRDSMTNLLNHKNSLRRLKEEVDRAKRIDYPLSVAMIDLDNFKQVNDTYGHQIGDEVLLQVARILSEQCRSTDVVGRYGGEEFIIIMPDTNDRDAVLLLDRIKTCIDETCFKDGIRVTVSGGVSELNGDSVHGILKSSDVMLYEAKKKGKNRVEVKFNTEKKSAVIN